LLPQHNFTHDENGKQLVRYVVRQEESKTLKGDSPASSVQNISPALKKTLMEMPHTNARKRDKPWKEYYDDETQKLVREMYAKDFEIYGYDLDLNSSAIHAGPSASDPPEGGWPAEGPLAELSKMASRITRASRMSRATARGTARFTSTTNVQLEPSAIAPASADDEKV